VTVLREPSSRVWSRYFYDGGGPAAKTEAAWLESSNCGGGGRGIGNRCLSNYYVRTFRGRGGADCDAGADGCEAGVPRSDLKSAKALLEAFDDVLVSEWLSHPSTSERLAKKLCFVPTLRDFPRSKRPNKKAAVDAIVSPSFLVKRAPGGKARRPADWEPSDEARRRVAELNTLDAELYKWAAANELERLKATSFDDAAGLPRFGETWRMAVEF